MFDANAAKAKTAEAMNDPQPGDRFTEMYAFYVYVLEREGNQVTFMECHPPCEVPKDGEVGTLPLALWQTRYAYNSHPGSGYSVYLVERGNDVSGWAKRAKHRLRMDASTPGENMKPKIEVNGNEVHLQVFDCTLERGASRFRNITLRKSDIPDVIEALQSVSGPTPPAPDEGDSSDEEEFTNPYLLSAQEIERTLALRR